MTRDDLIRLLNTLPRHSLQTKGWQMDVEPDEWGDYIEVDDIAKALGLVVDKVRNPETDSSRGFAEMPK